MQNVRQHAIGGVGVEAGRLRDHGHLTERLSETAREASQLAVTAPAYIHQRGGPLAVMLPGSFDMPRAHMHTPTQPSHMVWVYSST